MDVFSLRSVYLGVALLLVVLTPWRGGNACPIIGGVPDVWSGAAAAGVPDYFYPFGDDLDASFNGGEYDTVLSNISGFNLLSTLQYQLELSTYGGFAFNGTEGFSEEGRNIIAIYSVDSADIGSQNATIYYRETEDTTLICRASQRIRTYFPELNFEARWLFIATWDSQLLTFNEDLLTNTFQAVLATDGRYSFVLLNYGSLEWPDDLRNDTIFTSSDNFFYAQAVFYFYSVGIYDLLNSEELRQDPRQLSTLPGNRDEPGRYLVRVDNADSYLLAACDTDRGDISIGPRFGLQFGGKLSFITGPCFDEVTMDIVCRFGNREVAGVIIDSVRAACVSTPQATLGYFPFSMSIDGGTTFNYTSYYYTVEDRFDPDYLVTRDEDSSPWFQPPYAPLTIRWNSNTLNTTTVAIHLVTFDPSGNIQMEVPLGITPNSGSHVLPLDLPNEVPLDTHITGGTIRITPEPADATTESLWSDYHPTMWFLRRLVLEIIDRGPGQQYDIIEERATSLGLTVDELASTNLNLILSGLFANQECLAWRTEDDLDPPDFSPPRVPIPPCTARIAQIDRRFRLDPICDGTEATRSLCALLHPGADVCYLAFSWGGNGQQVCYDADGFIITPEADGGGTMDRTSPLSRRLLAHFYDDVYPYLVCCIASNNCDQYYTRRPTSGCAGYRRPICTCTRGDPHFQTLDLAEYTFNGCGEYWWIRADNNRFLAQGRTEVIPALATTATSVTAFVVHRPPLSKIEVSVDMFGDLAIKIAGVPFDYRTVGLSGISIDDDQTQIEFTQTNQGTEIEVVFRTASDNLYTGEIVIFKVFRGSMSVITFLPDAYQGETVGLMGFFDGDATNDLIERDGTVVGPNPTPQRVHTFGETWRTLPAESIFDYILPLTHSDFQCLAFVPTFLDAATLLSNPATSFCGSNLFCLYDFALTGDAIFAINTLNTAETFRELVQQFRMAGLPCAPRPCANGGACSNIGIAITDFECECLPNFTGTQCETEINACSPNPCVFGACFTYSFGQFYFCRCTSDYTGSNCDTRIVPCIPDPCTFGSCREVAGGTDYRCDCAPGYTGRDCNVALDDCYSNPCQNGGLCRPGPGGVTYTCACTTGYSGTNCDVADSNNPCRLSPCANGGTCYYASGAQILCGCTADFTGQFCRDEVQLACGLNPCQNGGTCINLPNNNFECICVPGFMGPTCIPAAEPGDQQSTRTTIIIIIVVVVSLVVIVIIVIIVCLVTSAQRRTPPPAYRSRFRVQFPPRRPPFGPVFLNYR